jgi:hypothetical protein
VVLCAENCQTKAAIVAKNIFGGWVPGGLFSFSGGLFELFSSFDTIGWIHVKYQWHMANNFLWGNLFLSRRRNSNFYVFISI